VDEKQNMSTPAEDGLQIRRRLIRDDDISRHDFSRRPA
jgi:hypothetical protein